MTSIFPLPISPIKNGGRVSNYHDSQIRNDPRLPTVNEPNPVNDIHYTPGGPLTIRAGMTVHFDLPGFARP